MIRESVSNLNIVMQKGKSVGIWNINDERNRFMDFEYSDISQD